MQNQWGRQLVSNVVLSSSRECPLWEFHLYFISRGSIWHVLHTTQSSLKCVSFSTFCEMNVDSISVHWNMHPSGSLFPLNYKPTLEPYWSGPRVRTLTIETIISIVVLVYYSVCTHLPHSNLRNAYCKCSIYMYMYRCMALSAFLHSIGKL